MFGRLKPNCFEKKVWIKHWPSNSLHNGNSMLKPPIYKKLESHGFMSKETKMTSLILSQLFACFLTLGICNFSTWFLAQSESHESETSPPNGWEFHSPHAGPSSWWPAVNQTVGKQVDGATNTHVSSQKGSTPSNNIRSSSSFRPLSPSLIYHEADYLISACKIGVFQKPQPAQLAQPSWAPYL